MQVAFGIVFFQYSAFIYGSYGSTKCRGDNSEQFAEFPLAHSDRANIGRQGDITLSVHRDDASFLFHWYSFMGYQMALQMLFSISSNLPDNCSKS